MLNEQQPELVMNHLYLVKDFISKRVRWDKLPPSIDKDDLYQEGVIELMRAAKKYKAGHAEFSTYADKCIRPRLWGYINDQRWGPKHAVAARYKKEGKPAHLDMLRYDSFAFDDIDDLFEKLGMGEESPYISRLSNETLLSIIQKLDKCQTKKIDKRSKFGSNGVFWAAHYNCFIAELRIFKKKWLIGYYDSAQEAIEARSNFIERVKDFCQERLANHETMV